MRDVRNIQIRFLENVANITRPAILWKISATTAHSVHCLQRITLCNELAEFFPNLCKYDIARSNCKDICRTDATVSGQSCGKSSNLSRRKRIVNGQISTPNQWYWHASLRLSGEHYCGASILSRHLVLTAAHCLDSNLTRTNDTANFSVAVGIYYRNRSISNDNLYNISKYFIHKGYTLKDFPRKNLYFFVVSNDIAIIELKRPIKWIKNKVQPICLPDETNPIPDNYKCNLIGWGQTMFDVNESVSDVLRFAEMTTIPLSTCNQEKAFNNTISSDNNICGKGRNFSVSPCTKDSGGGLACQKSGLWYLNGIVSSGYKCGDEDAYSLYTNVIKFKPWILQTLFKANTSSASKTLQLKDSVFFLILVLVTMNNICH